jgi:hypothetical protein
VFVIAALTHLQVVSHIWFAPEQASVLLQEASKYAPENIQMYINKE